VLADEALAEAQAAESELAAGRSRGALHGAPVAFKDLYALGRATAGSPLLADQVAAGEAAAVRRARAAGAVVLGKLATHEFGLAAATLADHFPPARNPWNPELTPGGSSTGAGAAVAAGLAFGAYGTGTGGRAGVLPLSPSLDHAGPFARTGADAAALFAAVAGHDPDDLGSDASRRSRASSRVGCAACARSCRATSGSRPATRPFGSASTPRSRSWPASAPRSRTWAPRARSMSERCWRSS
jgi:aspartyl-tRNA(Asn)/glutamyl-tRNA(Gln) amidotransferase subunit A